MSNKGTWKRVKFFTYLKKFEGVNYLYLHICFEISTLISKSGKRNLTVSRYMFSINTGLNMPFC